MKTINVNILNGICFEERARDIECILFGDLPALLDDLKQAIEGYKYTITPSGICLYDKYIKEYNKFMAGLNKRMKYTDKMLRTKARMRNEAKANGKELERTPFTEVYEEFSNGISDLYEYGVFQKKLLDIKKKLNPPKESKPYIKLGRYNTPDTPVVHADEDYNNNNIYEDRRRDDDLLIDYWYGRQMGLW